MEYFKIIISLHRYRTILFYTTFITQSTMIFFYN